MDSIRRKPPTLRGVFPDSVYRERVLAPEAQRSETLLGEAAVDVYRQHAIVLAEQRIIEPSLAARALRAMDTLSPQADVMPQHPLSAVEASIVGAASDDVLLGRAPEEIAVAAIRMVLRGQVLAYADALLGVREATIGLATGHLTTMILATSDGQVVEPTSLGHYLAGQIGPMARAGERLQGAWERLNRSPIGAVSGMSTAMPVRRDRSAALLGFSGLIDSTFDAISAPDLFTEITGIVADLSVALTRFVTDLLQWARDDVGLLVPDDAFVHMPSIQPQRRDPGVLDRVRLMMAEQIAAPARLGTMLSSNTMLGTDAVRLAAFVVVFETVTTATQSLQLLTRVLSTVIVNRAMFANRTNRGFATSSELADLLAIDFQLPAVKANELTHSVVVEWTEQGGDATTLTPEFIDTVALRVLGREIGIEPELLAKCLSPKRFIERRDVMGGPAPSAVSAALERATLAVRRDRAWVVEHREQLDEARQNLLARKDEIIAEPGIAISRNRGPQPVES